MFQKILYNLVAQFEKVFKHNNQGSYATKYRYREAFIRFLTFLAAMFHLEKIANIAAKHVVAYVGHLTEQGRSIAYIKTELSAIRFFHDQIPMAKHQLPTNKELGLGRRQYGGVDRSWSSIEFNRLCALLSLMNIDSYLTVITLAYYAGLRLHECFRIDTSTAQKAIRAGAITIKGKGGLVREVPINRSTEIMLSKMLERVPKGHKLFVAPDDKTHLAMHRLENFISYHNKEFRDAGSKRPLTFHGLRHSYAAREYTDHVEKGMSEREARLAVAKLLGHGRDSVTRIYLASLD